MRSWWLLTASSLSLLLIFVALIALMAFGSIGPGPASAGAVVCLAGMLVLTTTVRCDECDKSAFRRDLFTPGTALGETASYLTFWPERRCSRCGATSFDVAKPFGLK